MKIAVFGLGYVGVVNMACLASLGHEMWGCDIKSQKVQAMGQGKSPISEPGVDEMLMEALEKGLLNTTTDALEAIENTKMALICVGTPSREDGTVNLDYAVNTATELARCIRELKTDYTVVFRSTIPPGTIEEHFLPVMKRELGEFYAQVKVAFLPEFLREGSAVNDFFHCSRIVVGCAPEGAELVEEVFSYSPEIPLVLTDFKTAEFVKYVDNAFHAAKITFANEVYAVGSVYDVDIEKANAIFLMDTHLNISKTYLRPGLPFGGSCLPKDMRAINHLAQQKGLDVPLLQGIVRSNAGAQKKLLERINQFGKQKISLYGLTFKSGTDDVRESPMLNLLKELSMSGMDVKVYDQDINMITLRIENAGIVRHVCNSPEDAFSDAQLIVVCKKGFDSLLTMIHKDAVLFNCFNQEVFAVSNHQEHLY